MTQIVGKMPYLPVLKYRQNFLDPDSKCIWLPKFSQLFLVKSTEPGRGHRCFFLFRSLELLFRSLEIASSWEQDSPSKYIFRGSFPWISYFEGTR